MDEPISFRAGWAMLGGEGYSMKNATSALVAIFAFCTPVPAIGQTDMLPAPGFHHLHLNSVDPDAAIDFYTRQFSITARPSLAGLPALKSPNDVLVLFTKVATPPPTAPQTAIWHFGWHVTDVRKNRDAYKARRRAGRPGRDAAAALHRRRRRIGADQHRHLAGPRRRAGPHQGADRRRQADRRPAHPQGRLRLYGGPRQCAGGIHGGFSGRAHEPRALL